LANTRFQTVYNYIGLGLEPKLTARRYASVIWNSGKWNSVKWNKTRRIGAILHAFASRGFDSVIWAFLLLLVSLFYCVLTVQLSYIIYTSFACLWNWWTKITHMPKSILGFWLRRWSNFGLDFGIWITGLEQIKIITGNLSDLQSKESKVLPEPHGPIRP